MRLSYIRSIAVGYNHPELLKLARSDEFVTAAMNRPAIGSFPPAKWADWIQTGIGAPQFRPKGLDQVYTTMCGSCANESAFKAVFIAYQARLRGERASFTEDEIKSCMNNQSPGSPSLSILSFTKGVSRTSRSGKRVSFADFGSNLVPRSLARNFEHNKKQASA